MGTNYYYIADECGSCGRYDKIHIGKSSGGWPFSVHIIPEKNLMCWQDWYDKIKFQGRIKDEYGADVTLKELDELVKMKRGYKDERYVLDHYRDHSYFAKPDKKTGDTLSRGEFS